MEINAKKMEQLLIFILCLYVETVLQLAKLFFAPSKLETEENEMLHKKVPNSRHEKTYGVHWTGTKPFILCLSVGQHVPYLWSKQVAALSEEYVVVPVSFEALMQRGFKRRHFKLKNLADYCVDTARTYGAAEFTVMAHGIGVHLAWAIAQLHPQKVTKMIVVSAPHPSLSEEAQELRWKGIFSPKQREYCFIQLPLLPEWLLNRTSGVYDPLSKDVCSQGSIDGGESEEGDRVLEVISDMDYRLSSLHYLRNVSNPITRIVNGTKGPPLEDRVQCPVLFMIGTKDLRVTTEEICYSGQFVEKFCCSVIEGASSLPHWEDPGTVNSCISNFLAGAPTMRTPKRHQNGLSPVKDLVSKAFKGGASAVTSTMVSCVKTVTGGTLSNAFQKGVAGIVTSSATASTGLIRRALFYSTNQ